MEFIIRRRHIKNGNCIIVEPCIERFAQFQWVPFAREIDVGNLSGCVHACIGASGALHLDDLAEQVAEHALEFGDLLVELVPTAKIIAELRGWFPRDARDPTRLPEIALPSSPVHIEGKVRHSAGKLMQLGEPGGLRPGAIVQNAEVADFIRASKLPLHTFIIEQTSDTGDGLVRDWPLPSTGIDTHRGYAFQWYALSVAALIFFLVTGFQRASK